MREELIMCPHCKKNVPLNAAVTYRIKQRIKEEMVASYEKEKEEQRFKDLETEKLISDLRKHINELKRKAEQGSQQLQGEVLEQDLEIILRSNFGSDLIEPVAKGIKGADILQKVHNQNGHYCGAIIWEAKRTKGWKPSWTDKLKDDQRAAKADIAVLLTRALPKDCTNFRQINDVWVTNYSCVTGLATVLRNYLIEVARTKLAVESKGGKIGILYDYLSGTAFKQRVEAIVTTSVTMKEDLEREKRAYIQIWAKREKQIELLEKNIIGMYGDMQAIIGSSLPQIESLELPAAFLDEGASDG